MRAAVLTNGFRELEPFAESLELGRFVLTDAVPANAESWFLVQCWQRAAETTAVALYRYPTARQKLPQHYRRSARAPTAVRRHW